MNWDLITDPHARKQLKRIPQKEAKQLANSIDELRLDPYTGDVEKVGGEKNTWRRRSGTYRIFYEIYQDRKTVYISNVTRKTSTTYRKR